MTALRIFWLAMLFVTSGAAASAQAPVWQPGVTIGTGDESSTRTLLLETGENPGEYRLKGTKTSFSLSVFEPQTNRPYALPLTEATDKSNTFEKLGTKLIVISETAESAYVEITTTERARRLAVIELKTDTDSTTMTLQRENSGAVLMGDAGTVHLHFLPAKVLRSITPDGMRVVAPLEPGAKVRFGISREQ